MPSQERPAIPKPPGLPEPPAARKPPPRPPPTREEQEIMNANSSFLKLPAELRNEIYDLSLPDGQVYGTSDTEEYKIKGIEEA